MKFFAVFLGLFVMSSAFADEEAGVVARVTCADIQAQISELSAVEEPDTETIDELTKLKADYRRSCSRTARGRKTSAGVRIVKEEVNVTESAEDVTVETEEVVEEAKQTENNVSESAPEEKEDMDKNAEVEKESGPAEEPTDEPVEDELSEQEIANLDAGLCADGAKPNKFGCCGDELFKDLGNATFACCPKDGGDCFPPIK